MRQEVAIFTYAACGWAYCGALMGVGASFMSMDKTLVLHAIGAPLGFVAVSRLFFRQFPTASPVRTAALFLAVVVLLDLVVVAWLVQSSLEMFRTALGTWIPFLLIAAATYLTGRIMQGESTRST